ncbi:MAG: alpha/beta hydrolase [Deltaproteobacteria bacterium]|nr:MAG: alpha/beta hydrolase [Deltaproteobacteria bacterium]
MSPRWRWHIGVAMMVLSVALLLSILETMEQRLIFFPTKYPEGIWHPERFGLRVEDVDFTTADDIRLHGWWIEGESARAPVILFFHGNAGNLTDRIGLLRRLRRCGHHLFIFDYRGYGRSAGSPSEAGLYRDGIAAWRHLTRTRAIPPERIVLFGRSLGGAVAVEVALRGEAAGLILESTFTSIPDMARALYPFLPVGHLLRTRFETIAKIGAISMPLLVIHGTKDELVPFEFGRRLYEKAGSARKSFHAVVGAGHNDTDLVGGEAYLRTIDRFVRSVTEGVGDEEGREKRAGE